MFQMRFIEILWFFLQKYHDTRLVCLQETTVTQRLYARMYLSLDKNHDTLTSGSILE